MLYLSMSSGWGRQTALKAGASMPSTSGANESGCSIIEEVLPKFLGWLRKYPDELLSRFPDQPKYRELRRWADTKLRKLPEKLFPDGPLSEKSIANIWQARHRS